MNDSTSSTNIREKRIQSEIQAMAELLQSNTVRLNETRNPLQPVFYVSQLLTPVRE